MPADDSPKASGERFVPELMGGELIEAEHQARYRLAAPFVKGRRVLDAGCGTGWGTELLIESGARTVVGVDIAREAVDDARKRTPRGLFLEADLQDLPFDLGSFDVVVCLEVLEHTPDTTRTLDNLVRVLDDRGLLFVSSPNPGVYPPGNPFHFHELAPDELVNAVAARVRHVALFRQHLHLASTLCMDSAGGGTFDCVSYPIRPIRPGGEQYSVAVASNASLPPIGPVQALSPSQQLQNLDMMATSLTEERRLLAEDHVRIVAERQGLLDQLAALHDRLVASGRDLAALMAERDSAVARLADLHQRIDRASAERDRSAITLVRAERDLVAVQRRIVRVAEERDRFAVALVRAENDLVAARNTLQLAADASEDESQIQVHLEQLMAYASHLEQDRTALRATVSWRLTRPLRLIRARTMRRQQER